MRNVSVRMILEDGFIWMKKGKWYYKTQRYTILATVHDNDRRYASVELFDHKIENKSVVVCKYPGGSMTIKLLVMI